MATMRAHLIFENLEGFRQGMVFIGPVIARMLQPQNMRRRPEPQVQCRLDGLPVGIAVFSAEEVYEKSGVNDPRR